MQPSEQRASHTPNLDSYPAGQVAEHWWLERLVVEMQLSQLVIVPEQVEQGLVQATHEDPTATVVGVGQVAGQEDPLRKVPTTQLVQKATAPEQEAQGEVQAKQVVVEAEVRVEPGGHVG